LLLAVQEYYDRAVREGAPDETVEALAEIYYDVRSGLGFTKSAEVYGAFPTDPYSHTPAHAGAQQPGMTGQVKEEILTRWGELGVGIEEGRLHFNPRLLSRSEFGKPDGTLTFTYCNTPVEYRAGSGSRVVIDRLDGTQQVLNGEGLSLADSE